MGTVKFKAGKISSFDLRDYSIIHASTNGSTTTLTVRVTAIVSAVTAASTTTIIISFLFLLFLLQFSARFFCLQVAAMESYSIC